MTETKEFNRLIAAGILAVAAPDVMAGKATEVGGGAPIGCR
jgi:hypothetical protein